MQRDEAFLKACSQIHENNGGAAVQVVLDKLQLFPEIARSSIVLPELRKVAEAAEIGNRAFARKHSRPQILEVVQAPLTWVHGARIGVWSFSEKPEIFAFLASEPKFLVVTGKGPERVSALVSAIVNDLASERNCPSDLVLVGFSRFDLRDSGSREHGPELWTEEQFCKAVTKLARAEGAQEAIDSAGLGYIRSLAPRVLRHTIRMAKEALQRLELQTGFVSNAEIDMSVLAAAEQSLLDASAIPSDEQMPVLGEYNVRGVPLEIELNKAALGNEPYASVVREYKEAVRRQRVAEWERRLALYENWGRGAIHQWRALQAMDAKSLAAYSTTIGWEVDFETATQVRLDPPRRVNGTERLHSLPPFIIDNLAWWALAKYRIEAVSAQIDFLPWMDSYLIDAFLRGQALPHEEPGLHSAYENWQREWRPLALYALDGALRKQGLKLADIVTEQTIFRVMKKTSDKVVLRVLHVWDPSLDQAPEISDCGATLYRPRFAARSTTSQPAKSAQSIANRRLQAALEAGPAGGPDLVAAMAVDSGGAIDRLADTIAEPLRKLGIAKDLEKATNEAVRLDPFLRTGFMRKLQAVKFVKESFPLAQECALESRRAEAVPDFLAWEIFLVAGAVKSQIDNLADYQDQSARAGLSVPLETLGFAASRSGSDLILTMRAWSHWQIAEAAGKKGDERDIVAFILANQGEQYTAESLGNLVALFRSKHPLYADQCFVSEAGPPRSEELQERSVPNCLNGWMLGCFYLALGDAAAELARLLIPGGQGLDPALLDKLVKQLNSRRIHEAFPDLHRTRAGLVEELKKHLGANDMVSIEFASSKIRNTVTELTIEAMGAYQAAAVRDGQYGVAWLRIAGLKWALDQYREALATLAGPPPAHDLDSAQLPLALAIRLAGGSLAFFTDKHAGNWTSPAETLLTIHGPDDSGALTAEFTSSQHPNPKLGRCVISRLRADDLQLLADFMQRHEPDLLQSAGRRTLEEWFSLVHVPSLGIRGAMATALEHDAEFATLAAAVYLGTPPALQFPEGQEPYPHPKAWLNDEVITSLEW